MQQLIPYPAAILLAEIRAIETGRKDQSAYGVIYRHRQDNLWKPLTEFTLGEVIAAQPTWTKQNGSSAAGAYQFMRTTLSGLIKEHDLPAAAMFNSDLQDQLAFQLLLRRGYRQFMSGKISRTAFGRRLAQEWASFPVLAATKGAHRSVKRGETYYAGDKLNKALVAPERVERLLDRVKVAASEQMPELNQTPAQSPSGEKPNPEGLSHSKRFWTWLTTGGGTAALPFVDWRVQLLIAAFICLIAAYAIFTMPAFRSKLGLSNG